MAFYADGAFLRVQRVHGDVQLPAEPAERAPTVPLTTV